MILPVGGFIQNKFRYSLVVDIVRQVLYSIEYTCYTVIILRAKHGVVTS